MMKTRVLIVVNKKIPGNDYRIAFSRCVDDVEVVFGLPEKSDGLKDGEFVELRFTEGLNFGNIKELSRLRQVLLRSRPKIDFVHFFSTIPMLFGPPVARLCGTPCAITVTGLGRTFDQQYFGSSVLRGIYRRLMGFSVKRSDRVLFQNSGHMKLFESWFPDHEEKFRYVGSAVAAPDTPRQTKSRDQITVLHVARLLPSKGIEDFLTVARQFSGEDGFTFHLVGPPSVGYPDLHQQVEKANGCGEITYHGELIGSELSKLYERAHILFFPSCGEGMARVMLEAGLTGLYPIAYDIPANRDLVNEASGTLVECGDIEAVVEELRRLNADRDRLEEAAGFYGERIRAGFSVDAYCSRVSDALEDFF